jgi:hypothetical protein
MYRKNARAQWVMAFLLLLAAGAVPAAAAGPFQYFPLTPCRVVDTRQPAHAPALAYLSTRTFTVQGVCGVPSGAKAVTVNVTVAQPTASGYLRVYPSDIPRPLISTINFAGGETALANGAIVPLATTTPDLAVFTYFVASGNTTHFILDVTGYFQ